VGVAVVPPPQPHENDSRDAGREVIVGDRDAHLYVLPGMKRRKRRGLPLKDNCRRFYLDDNLSGAGATRTRDHQFVGSHRRIKAGAEVGSLLSFEFVVAARLLNAGRASLKQITAHRYSDCESG
jgi:hypothetical protein